jgi:hypothetical protein
MHFAQAPKPIANTIKINKMKATLLILLLSMSINIGYSQGEQLDKKR